MAVHIPELGRKVRVLGDHTDLDSAEQLAKHFDLSVSRINEWRTGGSKGQLDSVPAKHIPKLVEAFAKAFRHPPPYDELEGLIYGPADTLEDAIRDDAVILLEDILGVEARRDTGRLHRQDSFGLVENDDDDHNVDALPRVRIGERFMLEFATQKAGHVLVVTNAQQDWGLIKWAEGVFSKRMPAGSVVVPGIVGGRPIPLFERNTRGLHRFMLFISPSPFSPVFSQAHVGRKSFDWSMLCRLARHHDGLSPDQRELHIFSINMI